MSQQTYFLDPVDTHSQFLQRFGISEKKTYKDPFKSTLFTTWDVSRVGRFLNLLDTLSLYVAWIFFLKSFDISILLNFVSAQLRPISSYFLQRSIRRCILHICTCVMHIWCEILPCLIGWNYREDLEITGYIRSLAVNKLFASWDFNQYHLASKERYGEGKCKVTYDKLLILVSSWHYKALLQSSNW